jgi:hypothetical protein
MARFKWHFASALQLLLRDRLRGKRIRFTRAERALLARKAKAVGRKALLELGTIVSADTLLRWHRRLIGEKWNFAHRREVARHRKGTTDQRRVVRRSGDCSAFG